MPSFDVPETPLRPGASLMGDCMACLLHADNVIARETSWGDWGCRIWPRRGCRGRKAIDAYFPASVVLCVCGMTSWAAAGAVPRSNNRNCRRRKGHQESSQFPSLGRDGWRPDMQSCFAYSARGGHGGKLDEIPRMLQETKARQLFFSSWPVLGKGNGEKRKCNLQMSPWRTQRPLPSRLPCGDGCLWPVPLCTNSPFSAAGIVPLAPDPFRRHRGVLWRAVRREKSASKTASKPNQPVAWPGRAESRLSSRVGLQRRLKTSRCDQLEGACRGGARLLHRVSKVRVPGGKREGRPLVRRIGGDIEDDCRGSGCDEEITKGYGNPRMARLMNPLACSASDGTS
jgi:hypothetical protein